MGSDKLDNFRDLESSKTEEILGVKIKQEIIDNQIKSQSHGTNNIKAQKRNGNKTETFTSIKKEVLETSHSAVQNMSRTTSDTDKITTSPLKSKRRLPGKKGQKRIKKYFTELKAHMCIFDTDNKSKLLSRNDNCQKADIQDFNKEIEGMEGTIDSPIELAENVANPRRKATDLLSDVEVVETKKHHTDEAYLIPNKTSNEQRSENTDSIQKIFIEGSKIQSTPWIVPQ